MSFDYKITVFTPTYNRAYIIENLYRSIQRQTYRGFEWLVVDDGSSDGTEALFAKWMEEDNDFSIRYIKQEKVLCDYWLEDGTFLKIDAISIGYTLDMKKWQKIIDNIHVFFTARDVACFSMYSGLNPEVNINGVDVGYEWFNNLYPRTARFTLGAKITF